MFWITRPLRPATCLFALLSSAFGCSGHDSAPEQQTTFAQPATLEVMSETGELAVELRSFPEALPVRGRNRVQLTVTDVDGQPANDLELVMTPFMPAMGHGSGHNPEGHAVDLGVYEFDDVRITMPGRWELRTSISGGTSDELVFAFDVK